MPLIQVRVIKDVFSKEQKHQMIGKLTDAMVSIEGESMRNVASLLADKSFHVFPEGSQGLSVFAS